MQATKRREAMHKARHKLIWIIISLVGLNTLCLATTQGQNVRGSSAQFVAAILQEDWQRALDSLASGEPPDPAREIARAHALLALNKNNEALCHFLRFSSARDLEAWKTWTEALVQHHPQVPVAHYFRGDALARLAQWDVALQHLTTAVALQPHNALVLNARGVIYAALGQWDHALVDFTQAATIHPTFADAHASRGIMYIQKRDGVHGALKSFNQALHITPDFALALAGRGYAKLARGQWEEAQTDLKDAARKATCLTTLLAADLAQIATWMNEKDTLEVAEAPDNNPGTTLNRQLQRVAQGDVNALNNVASTLGKHPEYAPMVQRQLNSMAQADPILGARIGDKINRGEGWTSSTGGARGMLNFLKGFSVEGHLTQQGGLQIGPITAGRELGARAGFTPSALIDHQLRKTEVDHRGWQNLQHGFNTLTPGGVTSSIAAAHVDVGNWPFTAHYGLLYQTFPVAAAQSR
jgi:tetratricopeptide (TPR) repeat protein